MSHADAVRLQSGAREAVSDEDLDEAAHFSKYAFAAYGYMLYVWSKPLQKCARARTRCTCRMLCTQVHVWAALNLGGGFEAQEHGVDLLAWQAPDEQVICS